MDAAADPLLRRAEELLRRAEELLELALREAGGDKKRRANVQNALTEHVRVMQGLVETDMPPDDWVMITGKIAELERAVRLMSGRVATACDTELAQVSYSGGGAAAARAPEPDKDLDTTVDEVRGLLLEGKLGTAKRQILRRKWVVPSIVKLIKEPEVAAKITEVETRAQAEAGEKGISKFGWWIMYLARGQGLKM